MSAHDEHLRRIRVEQEACRRMPEPEPASSLVIRATDVKSRSRPAASDGSAPEPDGDDRGTVHDGLTVRPADLSLARPPRWAWQHRIALSYLNLLLGNEGIGKGTLVAWLVGRLTHGDLPGDLRGQPVAVGIIGDEDSFNDVWVPRLHAAGADLSLVHAIEKPDGYVDLKDDRVRIAAAARAYELRVLFFDQLLDNLGVNVDDWRNKQVRHALQPLRAIARDLEVAAIGCLHPNKHGETFRQLSAGAPAFNAVSRSSLLLAEHPEDDERRVLVRGKGNLSIKPPAIEFVLESHVFHANGHTFNVPRGAGFAESALTVDDLIGSPERQAEHSKVNDAAELIEALLPRDGKWHPARPIIETCDAEGIDERTAQRAKQRLGVEHHRTTTFPATTEWRWPSSPDTLTTCSDAVATVATVVTASVQNPTRGSSHDTHDSHDNEKTRRECVATGDSLVEATRSPSTPPFDGEPGDDVERSRWHRPDVLNGTPDRTDDEFEAIPFSLGDDAER